MKLFELFVLLLLICLVSCSTFNTDNSISAAEHYILAYVNRYTNQTVGQKLAKLYYHHTTLQHLITEKYIEVSVYEPQYVTTPTVDPVSRRVHYYQSIVSVEKKFSTLSNLIIFIQLGVKLLENDRIIYINCTLNKDKEGYLSLTQFIPMNNSTASNHFNLHQQLINNILDIEPAIDSSSTLRVLCVNLWNYNYWNYRMELIHEEISRLSPDIIAFQEARLRLFNPNNSNRSQIEDIAAYLAPGYDYIYYPAMSFKESATEFVAEGLAIFSRKAIIQTDVILLSRDALDVNDFHQRAVLVAKIQYNSEDSVYILTTHLSLSDNARNRSIVEIGNYITKINDSPVALMGDFNSLYDDNIAQLVVKYNLTDCWQQRKGPTQLTDQSSWTFNNWQELVYPTQSER
jgi:endonuclease/exonuclease/phosphatase family metal-dependent hydrolase